jgi:type II secretory pathway component PulM
LPGFSGSLFSWREHYHPIFQKMVPLYSAKAARERRFLAWLSRITLWAAVLAALTTVGCEYFRH